MTSPNELPPLTELTPLPEILERNALLYGSDVSLVELSPETENARLVTWKDFELIEPPSNPVGLRRSTTWKKFNELANRFANLLLSRGLKKGDKVAILLLNCLEWLPIYFGALKAGAVAVPLNFRYAADEIKYCLELSEASYLVFGSEFIGRLESICDELTNVKSLFFVGENCPTFAEPLHNLTLYTSNETPEVEISPDDDAAIYFSSGTTGFPKAILHPHRNLTAAAFTEQHHHSQTREDVFLCIPPLYHTGAKMHWFGSLLVGGKAVLLRGIKPPTILHAVSEERCTIVWLLVPWAQDILDAIESKQVNLDDYVLSQWRLMHIGAQPVPPSLIKRWKKYFPLHEYDTNYGLSESTGPGCVHLGVGNIHKVGAIGKPGYRWQVRIVDEDHKTVERGEVGELAVSGPGVMREYYRDPEATKKALVDGWLYTGDMACEDEEGFIFLVDRKKDVIIMGGENLYPVQIEDFIRGHDDVKDVAVIGLPDARLGEIAAAIVELKPGRQTTEEELAEFCLGLPRYKRPKKFIFADVPRNPTGKIEKPKLRDKYCGKNLVVAQIER